MRFFCTLNIPKEENQRLKERNVLRVLRATLCMTVLCACRMRLPINYVNNEKEMCATYVAQRFTVIALSMVFLFQPLPQSVSSPTCSVDRSLP